jgi:hypothetical protein
MNLRNCIVGTAALSLLAIVAAIAQDATTMPSEEHRTTRTRMVAPFNLLSDLSDDQKSKIADIHRDELAQEHALRAKEHDDIMALLSDDQKKELDDALARTAAERKAVTEERRAKTAEEKAQDAQQKAENMGEATSQPSGQ